MRKPLINNPEFIRSKYKTPLVYLRLKECPRCGGHRVFKSDTTLEAILKDEKPPKTAAYRYFCDICRFQTRTYPTPLSAKIAWNTLKRREFEDE